MSLSSGFLALVFLSYSSASFAALEISCANKKNTVKWSYTIKGSASARLGSDVLYTNGAVTTTLSSLNVAQYSATNQNLSILIDDANENIVYRFSADKPTRKPFDAKLEIVTPKVIHALTCTATTI